MGVAGGLSLKPSQEPDKEVGHPIPAGGFGWPGAPDQRRWICA